MNIKRRLPERDGSENQDNRSRFLEAADDIFLAEGYKGASIRKISARAKTGLAFLSRHWPSKETLFRDVFARHFDPIHREQERRLDSLGDDCGLNPKDILEAFFLPAFELNVGVKKRGAAVYCHALIDPDPDARKIIATLIGDIRQRVVIMLRQSLPSYDERRFFAVMNIVMGAFVFPQVFGHQLATAMRYDHSELDGAEYALTIASLVCDGISTRDPSV